MLFYTDILQNDELKLVIERTFEGNDHGWVPAYYFAIYNHEGTKIGTCDLRIGHNEGLYYGGNIGYSIDAPFRGHHYAGKACLLLCELAKSTIWIM